MALYSNFYYAMELDTDATLQSMFWADSRIIDENRTSLERIVGDCFTGEMFKLFQKEFIDSKDYWHKRVNKEGTAKTYKVGLCTDDVVCDKSESVTVQCDCAKFETNGYLCKHIIHIMVKKQLQPIPEKYILKRWTIGARYLEKSKVSVNEDGVTPIMKWQLAALANKTVDKATTSLSTYRELYCMLEGLQGKFNDLNLIENHITPTSTPDEIGSTPLSRDVSGIFIRDPHTLSTKGRPKMTSRIPAEIKVS
ncbi:SWIM domain-containing protein [Cephalotus follicularis]|uniref:SWIM domain-containing protein n=1 Tax=Cephalotus follicularis TaxID=3775 RepID=A0A1Q3D0C2_CEPFO|nr:SWIM domain-containing protein [Cephalotus follicularis]